MIWNYLSSIHVITCFWFLSISFQIFFYVQKVKKSFYDKLWLCKKMLYFSGLHVRLYDSCDWIISFFVRKDFLVCNISNSNSWAQFDHEFGVTKVVTKLFDFMSIKLFTDMHDACTKCWLFVIHEYFTHLSYLKCT